MKKETYTNDLEAIMRMKEEELRRRDPVQRELNSMRNDLDDVKEGMRKMGVLLDTDLPEQEAFEQFKMLREAYKKYKMVEKLVLGEGKNNV